MILHPATLIVFAGLPASGKSYLAALLAGRIQAVVLDKDPIRAALFPPHTIEYSRRQDDFCMDILYQTADYLLKADPNRAVIIDGRPYIRAEQVQAVYDFFQGTGTTVMIIECICGEATARRRLEADAAGGHHPAANRGFDLYRKLKAQAEPIPYPHLTVNTDLNIEDCLQSILAYLSSAA